MLVTRRHDGDLSETNDRPIPLQRKGLTSLSFDWDLESMSCIQASVPETTKSNCRNANKPRPCSVEASSVKAFSGTFENGGGVSHAQRCCSYPEQSALGLIGGC